MEEKDNGNLLPTRLGDDTALLQNQPTPAHVRVFDSTNNLNNLGSGDTQLYVNWLDKSEFDTAFETLCAGKEFQFQQWYHMPNYRKLRDPLLPLRRIKVAMANPNENGDIPLYRFPVNHQSRYGEIVPMTPTIEFLRKKAEALLGLSPEQGFNHAVVLLYRDSQDCIGFHKDKTLDLAAGSPIVSISLGAERTYLLRDNIHSPQGQQELKLPHGALLVLGSKSNEEFYHSIRQDSADPVDGPRARVSVTFRRVGTYKNPKTGEVTGQGAQYQTLDWPIALRGSHRYDDDLDAPSVAEKHAAAQDAEHDSSGPAAAAAAAAVAEALPAHGP